MAKGFSENEKILIRQSIIDNGINLFSSYGLKKTGIKDITNAVGIAQGSFYIFFNSKEELYFEILELEEKKIKETLINEVYPLENNPEKYIELFLTRSFELVADNPLLLQLYEDNSLEIILRKLPKEKLESHIRQDSSILSQVIKIWESKGIHIKESPETITGLMRSLFILSTHKKEIGEHVYNNTVKLLIKLISTGLVNKEMKLWLMLLIL